MVWPSAKAAVDDASNPFNGNTGFRHRRGENNPAPLIVPVEDPVLFLVVEVAVEGQDQRFGQLVGQQAPAVVDFTGTGQEGENVTCLLGPGMENAPAGSGSNGALALVSGRHAQLFWPD